MIIVFYRLIFVFGDWFYRAMSTGGEVLRLRGLPWTAGTAEVAQFLHECLGDSESTTGNRKHKYNKIRPPNIQPLFLKINPTNTGFFQSKQGSFGFQVFPGMYL